MKKAYFTRLLTMTMCPLLYLGLMMSGPLCQAQSFGSSALSGITVTDPTTLDFGPDGRLYVAEQHGTIYAYTVQRNSANNYSVSATETISLIKNIPNHDDSGNPSPTISGRQVTGLVAVGTAANPILFVSSSDPREGAGAGSGLSGDLNLDTNSGVVTKLTWNGSSWDMIHLVRGLARSEENHAVNGMAYDAGSNTLYVTVGGFTNAGAPCNAFALTCEYATAAAILSVNLNVVEGLPTKTDSEGQLYKYDLPTLDNPNQIGGGDVSGNAVPWGGNDGLNQAMLVVGGPVQVYSSGWRNAYDVVLTQAGRLYSADNGANQGWGGHPYGEGAAYMSGGTLVSDATNEYCVGEGGSNGPGTASCNQSGDPQVDNKNGLHLITGAGYYAGHPNPIRANPTGAGLYKDGVYYPPGHAIFPAAWPPVPPSLANPHEGDYILPSGAGGADIAFNPPTCGMTEYTASNFSGAMQGSLLIAAFSGNGKIFQANLNGSGVPTGFNIRFSGFGSGSLDVTAQGDGDIFPGTVWAACHGADKIQVFEPNDYGGGGGPTCTGNNDNTIDEDGDGFTNADELDPRNNTDPCSAGSKPDDNDGTLIGGFLVSDWNDPDDDDDGLPDLIDPYCIDPLNGAGLSAVDMPLLYPFFNADPGTGFFGLGLTGLMVNGSTDYLSMKDPDEDLIAGGATGQFTDPTVDGGSPFNAANDALNTFQFGMDISGAAEPVRIRTQLNGPFFSGGSHVDYHTGLYIGSGDQDDYIFVGLKGLGSGNAGLVVINEVAGVATSTSYPIAGILSANPIHLFFEVNPANGLVQPLYQLSNGPITTLGTAFTASGATLNAIQGTHQVSGQASHLAIGMLFTSGAGTTFTTTFDFIEVYTINQAEVLATNPSSVDFGGVQETVTATESIDLSTALNFDIDVTAVTITGADAAEFGVPGANPQDILPASPKSMDVTFTPASEGAKSATLVITHTGTNSPLNIPLAGTGVASGSGTVLFRVNCGGGLVSSTDAGPDWLEDTNSNPSGYKSSGSNHIGGGTSAGALGTTNIPAGTPTDLFLQERYDVSGGSDMGWEFPVSGNAGDQYEVRLYLVNSCNCTSSAGQRVFDISIEGNLVQDNLDLSGTYGHQEGVMLSYFVVYDGDGNLDIDFGRDTENPIINAIEIIDNSSTSSFPVEYLSFDAEVIDNQHVNLNWITASETNNRGFDIEFLSLEEMDLNVGYQFKSVGFIAGQGTTTEATRYTFTVVDLDPGVYIFRLKQIDFDGHYRYSDQVRVTLLPEQIALQVYPNPASELINVSIETEQTRLLQVSLLDASGREVRRQVARDVMKGTHKFQLPLDQLAAGVYLLKIHNGRTSLAERMIRIE